MRHSVRTFVGMAAAVVAGLGFARAETPDFAHAAVTDMNPGVMLSVSWLEVEGDAPYIFYAAKPGAYYFWGRADGAEKGEQSTVNVRYAGFHRFKKPGKKYVMELASCPVALWFGDGPVKYRALPPPPKCKNTELFGKLWYHEPNGEVRVDEVAAEDAPKVCKTGCAFLNPTRFWHVAPLGLAAPVPPPAPKKAASGPKPDPQPTADDIAKMEAVVADTSFAQPKAPRKVVLFNNCYGYRHSGATGFGPTAFKLAAEKTGAFAVTVETDLQRLADAEFLKGFDAIVLNSTTSIEEKKVPGVTKALTGAVAGGRGLVLLHAAVDAFYESPEIQKMNGSLFFGHPWSSPGTWSFVNEQPENPINAPFRKLPVIMKFSDEIYQFSTPPYSRANCDVLVSMDMSDTLTQAAADRWGAGWYGVDKRRFDGDYAVSYTKRYGEGRVFYTSFGHDHRAFLDARFAHMLLGLQWTLGDLEVPKRDDSALVDRLWMWGHEPECWHRFVEPFARLGMDPSNHCGQAAGCKLMGIRRDCMIRWLSLPELPLTDEKVKELSTLDELAWSITDSDRTRSFLEKVDIAISMKKRLPNLTTVFLDDYFQSHMRPLDELRTARERVHAAGLRMAAVMYADVEGYRESDLPSAKLCDVIALWFWKPDSFDTMEQKVLKAKEFLGADMPLMLGLYMWNFGDGFGPVTGAKMKAQLAVAGKLLRDGTVGGLIFHPTISADMDVPSVNISKDWIRSLGK